MNQYQLNFHHLGLAVRKPDHSIKILKGLGYEIGNPVLDPLQNANLVFCAHPAAPDVEIIYATNTPGPLESILKDNPSLIYHMCYESGDLQQSIRLIKQDGHSLVNLSELTPALLFNGRRVSFYYWNGFGIVEFLEGGEN